MTRGRGGVATALLLVALSFLTTPAVAQQRTTTTTAPPSKQRQDEIAQRIKTLREQVAEASEEEGVVLDRIDAANERKRQLDDRVSALDAEIMTAETDLADAQARLAAAEEALATARQAAFVTEDQLLGAHSELRRRAVAAYIGQPHLRAADLALRPRSARASAATASYLKAMVRAQAASVRRYTELRDQMHKMRDALESTRNEAELRRREVDARAIDLAGARDASTQARAASAAEEKSQRTLLSDVRKRVREFEGQIAALKKESDAIAAMLRARQAGRTGVTLSGKGALAVPAAGPVSSGFGRRVHPIFGTIRMHTGIDIDAGNGSPIRAAADGVVVWSGDRGGYGLCTIIDHGGNLATLYAHQSRTGVAEGATVKRGQVIGAVGSTGFSTGPHLHFEVRVGGNPVDPVPYL